MPTNTSSLTQVPRPRPAAGAARVTTGLPAPTGPHPVGVTDLHLADQGRPDPRVAGAPRELVVSVHYPARPSLAPLARLTATAAAEALGAAGSAPGAPTRGLTTNSRTDAPAAGGRYPVVLFSPGAGRSRAEGTPVAEELASRGYVVVSVDHVSVDHVSVDHAPEPAGVPAAVLATRVADLRSVLDHLAGLTHRLPVDLARVGVLGRAAGGVAAARTAGTDPRVGAGAGLDDGTACARTARSIATTCPDRPFLLVSAGTCGGDADLSWREPGRHDHLRHVHVGTDPVRAATARRTHVAAFFDRHLKG
ncbi:hypothetical protein [Saccharothrix sp. Mg75]|uniref:alpha/beta hydrolase n=1 Tax=Saccharothrix sp. Mg75 TaxID=3445357 RepID=UPI003EEBCA05